MFDDDEGVDLPEDDFENDFDESDGDTDYVPMEFGVDFETGQLTGGKVTGAQAVAVWAWNALMYPRGRYELSTTEYGSELSDMIGDVMDDEEASMTAEAIIRDALLPNEFIEDISDLECELEHDKLTVSFTIITPFGEEEVDGVTIQ